MPPTDSQRLAQTQRPAGLPVMQQRWAGLGFFHWEIDPEIIAARLPAGLHVDTFGGKAYLGIVPFCMERIRPVGLPPLPWLSWFHELNLRTYVHDDAGNPGVWCFSLDCNSPLLHQRSRRYPHRPRPPQPLPDRAHARGKMLHHPLRPQRLPRTGNSARLPAHGGSGKCYSFPA